MSSSQAEPGPAVRRDGRVVVGRHQAPLREVNLADAPVRHKLSFLRDVPLLSGVERAYKRLRMKQWHYASVALPRHFVGCVAFDAGYLGVGFAYVVDRETGAAHEFSTLIPGARGVVIAPSSVQGPSSVARPGFGEVRFDYTSEGARSIEIDVAGHGHKLRASLRMHDEGAPMVVTTELRPGRWLYTHKAYGLPAEGFIEIDGVREEAGIDEALGGLDWNRGHRLLETYWNWAAGTGRTEGGARIGFTMTAHVQTGEAASSPRGDTAKDCALWIDGVMIPLGRVRFEYERGDVLRPWRIRDEDGVVDLSFHPLGERQENVNYGVLVSRFHQPFGRFEGTIRGADGARHALVGTFGVTEEHFARW